MSISISTGRGHEYRAISPRTVQKQPLQAIAPVPQDGFQRTTQVRFGHSDFTDDSAYSSNDIIDEVSSRQWEPHRPMSDTEKLIAAIQDGKTAEAQVLVSQIPNINAYGESGETALAVAAKQGNLQLVNALLSREGIDVNQVTLQDEDQQGPSQTPLMLAIANGHENVAMRLLDHAQLDVGLRDENSRTALMWAAIEGNVPVLKKILERGGDLHQRDGQRRNALALASLRGQADMVRFLLAQGADANHTGDDGRNALALAQAYGHQSVVDILTAFNNVS